MGQQKRPPTLPDKRVCMSASARAHETEQSQGIQTRRVTKCTNPPRRTETCLLTIGGAYVLTHWELEPKLALFKTFATSFWECNFPRNFAADSSMIALQDKKGGAVFHGMNALIKGRWLTVLIYINECHWIISSHQAHLLMDTCTNTRTMYTAKVERPFDISNERKNVIHATTGWFICSETWVGLSLIWMFHLLFQLHSRTGQKVKQLKSKSTQPNKGITLYKVDLSRPLHSLTHCLDTH